MGQSTDGILAYGYDIGGEGPPVTGIGEYDSWRPDDFTTEPGSDEYYEFDFRTWAEHKLLAAAGHPVKSKHAYYDPDDLMKYHGVKFVWHCSGSYPHYMLVTFEESASRGYPRTLDLAELERRRVDEDWDGKLAAALKALGIPGFIYPDERYSKEPKVQEPHWMLASYWSS